MVRAIMREKGTMYPPSTLRSGNDMVTTWYPVRMVLGWCWVIVSHIMMHHQSKFLRLFLRADFV